MKKSVILLAAALLLAAYGYSEIIVYKTYEDFMNKIGEKYDSYRGYQHVFQRFTLYFVKNGEKIPIECSKMWGFQYDTALFRSDHRFAQPVRVINAGKICYYENGIAHLEMLNEGDTVGNYSVGYACAVSSDLNSPIYPFPTQALSDKRAMLKKFVSENPQYHELFEWIGRGYDYKNVRKWVQLFEEGNFTEVKIMNGDVQFLKNQPDPDLLKPMTSQLSTKPNGKYLVRYEVVKKDGLNHLTTHTEKLKGNYRWVSPVLGGVVIVGFLVFQATNR